MMVLDPTVDPPPTVEVNVRKVEPPTELSPTRAESIEYSCEIADVPKSVFLRLGLPGLLGSLRIWLC
jgi:hypothetical protein